MTYRYYDLTLASDIRLPELASDIRRPALASDIRAPTLGAGRRGAPDLAVRLGHGRRWVGGRWRWFRVWASAAGTPRLRVGKAGGRYLLRFPRQADFLVDADGATICYPRPALPRATLRHLLLDLVLPLVLGHHGRLILHASAVAAPGGGVAFLAGTGTGKSTVAAALGARWPIVADDTLLLTDTARGLVARAAYPGLRLWPASLALLGRPARLGTPGGYSRKRRIGPNTAGFRFRRGPVRLRRLYVLSPSAAPGETAVAITGLSRREAVIELVRHAYTLDTDDRTVLGGHFERLSAHALAARLRRVSYPTGAAHLPAVCAAIRADVAGSGDAG